MVPVTEEDVCDIQCLMRMQVLVMSQHHYFVFSPNYFFSPKYSRFDAQLSPSYILFIALFNNGSCCARKYEQVVPRTGHRPLRHVFCDEKSVLIVLNFPVPKVVIASVNMMLQILPHYPRHLRLTSDAVLVWLLFVRISTFFSKAHFDGSKCEIQHQPLILGTPKTSTKK